MWIIGSMKKNANIKIMSLKRRERKKDAKENYEENQFLSFFHNFSIAIILSFLYHCKLLFNSFAVQKLALFFFVYLFSAIKVSPWIWPLWKILFDYCDTRNGKQCRPWAAELCHMTLQILHITSGRAKAAEAAAEPHAIHT